MFHKCETESEVKKLFRRVAMRLHPDHGGDHELMILLQEAYEIALEDHKPHRRSSQEEFEEQLRRYARERERASKQEQKAKPKPPPEPEWDGVYRKVTESVMLNDERIKILEEILAYAEDHPSFKPDFVLSVKGFLDEHCFVTSGQYNSLVNIYFSFRMDEKPEPKAEKQQES